MFSKQIDFAGGNSKNKSQLDANANVGERSWGAERDEMGVAPNQLLSGPSQKDKKEKYEEGESVDRVRDV